MKSRFGRQDLRVKIVRFAIFFQGRCVMTPLRLNSRRDERSPAKSRPSRDGGSGQVRSMSNFSRRGIQQLKCMMTPGRTLARMIKDLIR